MQDKVVKKHHWSSGYDARLTRERSPVQSWDAVLAILAGTAGPWRERERALLLIDCTSIAAARLAQSVERQPFKLVVVGSSPTWGVFLS